MAHQLLPCASGAVADPHSSPGLRLPVCNGCTLRRVHRVLLEDVQAELEMG